MKQRNAMVPVAMLVAELSPIACHRSAAINALLAETRGWSIVFRSGIKRRITA